MGKRKQETKTQQTVTPTNPAFVTQGVQSNQGRIDALAGRDPREFVAPSSPLQNAAFSLGGGLANRMSGGAFDFSQMQFGGDNSAPSVQSLLGSTSMTPPGGGSMRPTPTGGPPATFTGELPSFAGGGGGGGGFNDIRAGGFAQPHGFMDQGGISRFPEEVFAMGAPVAPPGGQAPGSAPQPAPQAQQQRDPVTGAAAGQVGAVDLAGPNPADFFTGAGLLAGQVGMSGANTVGDVAMSQPGLLGPAQGYRAAGPAGVERGRASGPATAAGYNPAERAAIAQGQASGPAGVSQAGVSGAQTSLLGDPSTYAASLVGNPQSVNLQGFDAAQGQATRVGALPTAQSAQIGQADIDRFMNPYLGEVVDSTRADMEDQFGRQSAALRANAAGAGAFGGSRFGVREAELDGQQSRALGSTLGGLRASGFNTALDFADRDTTRRQQSNMADFGLQGQAALADANAANTFGLANMDSENAARRFSAEQGNMGLLANQDAGLRAALADAGFLNEADMFGANAANEFDRLNQQAAQQIGLFNAGEQNVASRFNAGEANRSALDAAGRSDQFGLANMDAFNRAELDRVGRQDQAGAFAADALNRSGLDFAGRSDAVGMANMDATNRSLLDFMARQDQSGQFNAGALNDFARTQFGADTDANFRNADAMNNMGMFNAGQRDTNLARRLQAAGLLGDLGQTIGSEDRANIGLLAGMGDQQREIDRAFRNAEPTMAELLGGLTAQQQYALFRGENNNTNTTQTQKGSTLDQIGQAVGIATSLGGLMPGGGKPGGGGGGFSTGGGFVGNRPGRF